MELGAGGEAGAAGVAGVPVDLGRDERHMKAGHETSVPGGRSEQQKDLTRR